MTLANFRDFLGWCTLFDYALLLVWFLFFAFGRAWLIRFHGQWFRCTDQQFDGIHYQGMAIFKIAIFVFNLVPYLALRAMA
ncbi:MAG: hypothetical protein R3F20_19470 [Planctomycetota bacterium]